MAIATMTFSLTSDAASLGIRYPAVCLIRNIKTINGAHTAYDRPVENLMTRVKDEGAKWLEKDEVKGYRGIFINQGYPKQTPAGERMFKSFSEKGFKRINNIVDAYNIVSLEAVAGIGVHDAKGFLEGKSSLTIQRAADGFSIIPSFDQKQRAVKVVKNDLVYGLKKENTFDVLAWLGKQDKDSDSHKVTDETKDLLVVVLGNEHTDETYNRNICTQIFNNIKLTCEEAELNFLELTRA